MIKGETVLTNMLWRLAERSGTQLVSFVVSIILARLLLPEDYGVISLITVFITILTLLVDGGFSNALIQNQHTDQLDYSTVFYFNLFLGFILYIGLYAAAPAIAIFYDRSDMVPYIRVLSLTLIIGGANGVQQALVAKRMQYKLFFFSSLIGTLLSAMAGVAMAFTGFGAWALIAQKLIDQGVDAVLLWYMVRWHPSLQFSFKRLKPLASYGSKLLGSALLNSFSNNLASLMVGKLYSHSSLAYYDKGQRVPMFLVSNLQATVQSVLFPAIAEQQSEKERVRYILHQSVMLAAYCIFPCMVGMAVCADSIVQILFTDRWIEMVPYMRLWCFVLVFYLLHTANLQVIQALGRSDIFLRIEIIKQLISLISMLAAIPFGVLAMLGVVCAEGPLFYYINSRPNERLVGYGFWKQIKDIIPIILLNIFLGLLVWTIGLLPWNMFVVLTVQITAGVLFYIGASAVFKIETFGILLSVLKRILFARRKGRTKMRGRKR